MAENQEMLDLQNVFYFSLYYCENTGCLHCNS